MWSEVYRAVVLGPDYAHARRYLLPHLYDGLTAHALMLSACGVAGAAEAATILRQLRRQPFPAEDEAVEDVFFAVDRALSARDPGAAGALRTALSRNDLDMTLYRLRAREQVLDTAAALNALRATLLALAAREAGTLLVAHTHHQPAQPTTLGHYLCALENSLARDAARLRDAWPRLNRSPMGAVALSGTGFPIDRDLTARLLAFEGPVENTFDAVAAGDWALELAGMVATSASSLSRLLYDLLFWAAQGRLTLADGLVQGSSVMPQKRNPVALEHARSKLSKTLGAAAGVLASAHNIPYGDVNDVGNDLQPTLETLWAEFGDALALLTASLEDPTVDRAAWAEEARHSASVVTELADALAAHSGNFRSAHAKVKALLAELQAQNRPLTSATADDLAHLNVNIPEAELRAALDPRAFVERRRTPGGPAPEALQAYFEMARARLDADRAGWAALQARLAASRAELEGPPTPT